MEEQLRYPYGYQDLIAIEHLGLRGKKEVHRTYLMNDTILFRSKNGYRFISQRREELKRRLLYLGNLLKCSPDMIVWVQPSITVETRQGPYKMIPLEIELFLRNNTSIRHGVIDDRGALQAFLNRSKRSGLSSLIGDFCSFEEVAGAPLQSLQYSWVDSSEDPEQLKRWTKKFNYEGHLWKSRGPFLDSLILAVRLADLPERVVVPFYSPKREGHCTAVSIPAGGGFKAQRIVLSGVPGSK